VGERSPNLGNVYTFVDERNLFWHSLVFSAAERESAYVIDGLMRNDVVSSDIHSTDTHGYSEAIFADESRDHALWRRAFAGSGLSWSTAR